jgi:hypothetical protein
MIVIGLLAAPPALALASAGTRHADLGELQRAGQEGRGVATRDAPAPPADSARPTSGLGLGELQQRGEEGRGAPRTAGRADAATPDHVDLGDAQRRAQEGRGEPGPGSRTRTDVASRQ